MKKTAHFNPKSLNWIISLIIIVILCVGVIFGSKAIYDAANKKYNEPVEVGFTIASQKDADISNTNADNYSVKSLQEAYDDAGNLVAYIVECETVGYNQESPIDMTAIISSDGQLVCGIDILEQKETEYLGVRIEGNDFKKQFDGRYLPVVASSSTEKGSKIDVIANSTISSQAVIDGVNNAQSFVNDNFAKDAE